MDQREGRMKRQHIGLLIYLYAFSFGATGLLCPHTSCTRPLSIVRDKGLAESVRIIKPIGNLCVVRSLRILSTVRRLRVLGIIRGVGSVDSVEFVGILHIVRESTYPVHRTYRTHCG